MNNLSDKTTANELAELEYDGGGDMDPNEEEKIDQECLELAGTYFYQLCGTLIDKLANEDIFQRHFKQQFCTAYDAILVQHMIENIGDYPELGNAFSIYCEKVFNDPMGKGLFYYDIEKVAIEHFRDQATRIVRG